MNRFKKISLFSLLCALCIMTFVLFTACSSSALKFTLFEQGETRLYQAWARENENVLESKSIDLGEEIVVPATHDDIAVCVSEYAFYQCTVNTITISEGVESIGYNAFLECSVQTINLPKSIIAINGAALMEAIGLSTINYAGTMAEWINLEAGISDYAKVVCSDGTYRR